MYKKVLVPLDGSKLAEIALPHAEEIAKGCSIPEIMLVSVTESLRVQVPSGEVSEQVPERQLRPVSSGMADAFTGRIYYSDSTPLQKVPVTVGKMAKAAKNYLAELAEKMNDKGFNTTFSVLIGNPAQEIVHFAEEEGADLIVMASHGRSGVSHWAVGSVAEKVFRATNIPVMLIKPKAGFKETKARRKGKPV